ncbi:acyl-CoA dehydrogenase family protein [Streptomyces sp. CB01881]|uniref:acyl-CoA dehydrogenase family protein n=1 Tax=Streptomyces sp. CB01881 TaxID=2078691 RepID=UPI0011DFE90E|nr:acyl-CoA dehydrogenase family protein [Streptomyces sp. CB01881]TYC69423.1 hypothetical protein EH183_35150 [Streptomyces sp. CB01881]
MDFEIREDRKPQGRRRLRVEREEYFRLVQQGYSNKEASRRVGVHERTGREWRNGRTDPNRFRAPARPERAPARTSGPSRYLSEDERIHIADRLREKATIRATAAAVLDGTPVAWALTEPDHGADLLNNELTATAHPDGYRLDGTKWPINNATRAGLLTLLEAPARRTPPPRLDPGPLRGAVLAGMSEAELEACARVFVNNALVTRAHGFGRFDGDVLVVVATEGRREDTPGPESRQRYVSGVVSAPRLARTHDEPGRPETLGEVWNAVAAWLDRE